MFASIASEIKSCKAEERDSVFAKEMNRLQFTDVIQLPIDPAVPLKRLIVEKSHYFESKTLPILFCFESSKESEEEYKIIFKAGDDLRQDSLILQMFSLMDKLWKISGLELHMVHYSMMATSLDTGLIEVVNNARTLASIQTVSYN